MDVQTAAKSEYIQLLGRGSLAEFLELAKRSTMAPGSSIDRDLAHSWRSAKGHIRILESTDAGYADGATRGALTGDVQAAANAILADPVVASHLPAIPMQWSLVELDRLVVYQNYIDLKYVEHLNGLLPNDPSATDIFRFVAGQTTPPPPIAFTRLSESCVQFSSISSDMRHIENIAVPYQSINGLSVTGRAEAVLAICIGYSSNILTAIAVRNRIVLGNGTHHAYVARARGITHVPCLLREIGDLDEIPLLRINELTQNSSLYLSSPRPPLFKDYFDPRLHRVLELPKYRRHLQVQVSLQYSRTPDELWPNASE